MLSATTFFEKISYKEIVAALVEVMAARFEDFATDLAHFKETISLLENELEENSSPSVSEEIAAIEQQIGSMLLFSCFLGLKANLDHFMDPITRTFMDVDAETYLQEDVAKWLPDYQNAQRVQKQFFASLSPAQQDKYEDITTYISHLETVGPKLAHYYGYMLGNQLFPRIIPGYSADTQLTLRYLHMLENYFGGINYDIRGNCGKN